MSATTQPERPIVVCPVCWEELPLAVWIELGCCISPRERAEFQW